MANTQLPKGVSVSDFAMDILNSMAVDPNATKPALSQTTLESANMPDLKSVEVSDDFVALITEGKRKSSQPVKKVAPKKIVESTENRIAKLVTQLSFLVTEAKNLVEELSAGATTTGNIGVNMAGSKKKSKKSDYIARIRSKLGKC